MVLLPGYNDLIYTPPKNREVPEKNTRLWVNIDPALGQRQKRWSNTDLILDERWGDALFHHVYTL